MGTVNNMRRTLLMLSVAAACLAPGLAHAQTGQSDPWEGFNRRLFAVHETVDKAVLEPVARWYRAITPEPVRDGVVNFLRNLRAPVTFANNLLQGDVGRAGVTAARFGVNTTIGIAGVFDPAEPMGLHRRDEDFGQTLAVWGVSPGPYVFIPLLGPSNVRDITGRVVDVAFDPLTWAEFEEEDTARAARGVMTGVSVRESTIEAVEGLRRDSIDPYVTIRSSYALLRESAVRNGASDVQDLPEFEDINQTPEPEAIPPASGGADPNGAGENFGEARGS